MQVPFDAIIEITADHDPITFQRGHRVRFTCKYPVSNRNEIPNPGDIIEADLGNEYVDAFITNTNFDPFDSYVKVEAEVVKSYPIAAVPEFSFNPSTLKQQLASLFPHAR